MNHEQRSLLIFGINPVLEKLKASPEEVFKIFVSRGHRRAALRPIEEEARRRGLVVHYMDFAELDRLARSGKHQGVVAEVHLYRYHSFDELLEEPPSSSGCDWILVLDTMTDPRNFGALLRSAEAVGVSRVVIPKDRSVGVTPAVVKTSAGAVHYLKIYRVSNLTRTIVALKEKGYWVIGLDAGAKEGIYERIYPEKLVLVLGAEGTGIRPLMRRECDFLVSIPMKGRIESLNVAVAGGVFLYELLRQKSQVEKGPL